ncbi:M20/M25/M40 family metallo-hydrolase [Nonomuraea sp. NPDC050394]|uniref:M20/M25/M40 family metallo-hydrolase n=1 Tax=Nonomuraea sp. NPDC050394 TaxID=3364363 RepID=UPI0037A2BC5B
MSRVLSLIALAVLVAVTMFDLAPPRSAATAFSAARAFEDVRVIAKAPHPTGSAANDRVREHLVALLREIGFDTRVQEGVGVLPLNYTGSTPVARVRNIVATRPGSASTGRIVLAAHYDSVPGAPGAADDGAGTAAVLEVARTLPPNLRNDVVVLLTDAEEAGLLGAEAFARQNRFDGPVVVLNHEARGVRGTVQMFRSSGGLIDVYGTAAPHPAADSAFASLMGLLPNNTDFHVFDQARWMGLDSAFVGGGAYYHTPLDDPAHLDRGSLQQMGDNALAVAAALGSKDLGALESAGAPVFFTVPGALVRYPGWLELPVAALALVMALAVVFVVRRRGLVSWPRALAGLGVSVVTVALAGAWGYALWPLLGALRPDYTMMFTGDPYRPWLYWAALLVFTAAIVLVCASLLRRRSDGPVLGGTACGGLLLVASLGMVSALLLPGGSHVFAWPALFAALGWLVSLMVPRGGIVALTAGLAPAAVMLGGTALTSLDIGLGIGGMLSAPHFALLLLLALPVVERPPGRTVLVALPVAAVALIAAGLFADRFDPAHPRQERVSYAIDTGTGEARWGRPGGDDADSVRFFGEEGLSTSRAPAAPLRAPGLTVLKDTTSGGVRTMALRLTPSGAAPVVGLDVDGQRPKITVAGRELGERAGFSFHAPPAEGVEVTLTLRAGEAKIRIYQQEYDMSVIPGYRVPEGSVQLRPRTTAFLTKIVAPAR